MKKALGTGFRLATIQMQVGKGKEENISHAMDLVRRAASESDQKPRLIALPECFNSWYGTKYIKEYAETIPGYTTGKLSDIAKELGVYLVGGTIPERDPQDKTKLYNTCTVWAPSGELIAKYRKMHMFDIDLSNFQFKESDVFDAGSEFATVTVDDFKIGLGICYDLRFEEHARIYRNMDCDMILYPAAFNMILGPLFWELMQRSRANDLQLYVATISPARDDKAKYVAWGNSMIVDPWGKVIASAKQAEEIVYVDIDKNLPEKVRTQIPVSKHRRLDMYETKQK